MAEYRRLGELCNISMGQSPDSKSYNESGNGLPFFQGNADFGDIYPTPRIWCNAPTKIVEPGTLLISVRAPIGALNFAKSQSCIGRGLAGITPKQGVKLKYIYYCLKGQIAVLNAKGTGSTFKAIAKNALSETVVKVVPEHEQMNVIQTLDTLSTVIAMRKQQLAELDNLVKARFVEMFGEPVSNPMGWAKRLLGEECSIITGNTPSRKVAEYYGDYIEWIKSDNINTLQAMLTVAEEGLSKEGLAVGRAVDPGSILMTCIAGSIGCIGNVAIADRKVAFNQQINGIIPHNNNVWFMYVQFELSKKAIQSSINMALKGILSKGQLSEMKFIFPPVELQNEYGNFVAQVDKSRTAVQKALDEAQVLFDSLMQEYFG